MKTREDIFNALKSALIELFETPEQVITLEASLAEDIDIDSIDSFDLLVRLEEETGLNLTPDDFKDCRTLGDLVSHLHKRINDEDQESSQVA
ncbi:MAG: hypothetical protein KDD62_00760 [Bdellovibrionales bacterium]|nr:hypothetical protein [Bdellovibrionales bacterium]